MSRYLVTLEQEGVLKYQVITPKSDADNLEVPIKAEYAPNLYVSVLGLTPRGEFPVYAGHYDTQAPNFYWGTLNLPVRQEVEGLQVKISPAVKELKTEPGSQVTLDFTVLAAKGGGVEAEMAVAVVDEAVLALTGFKTPTLDALTRFDRPLEVFTGELRALLVHQTPFYLSKNEPLTGGGGLNDEVMSKLRRRFEAVAYFNPSLRTDAQGRAQVSFTLPDNMTTYRIYAVVLDRGSRFANAERQLISAKDFYLEPGLPNYFIRGDSFRFLVAAFNTRQAKGPMQFRAHAQGGLTIAAPETAQLEPKGSAKLPVTGTATATGPVQVRLAGEFQGKQDEVELNLKVDSGLVRDTIALFQQSTDGHPEVACDLPEPLTLDLDPVLLRHALFNLLANAAQVNPPGAVITVRLQPAMGPERVPGWSLAVIDQGPGLTEAVRERLFTPFFTTRTTGTGLGLAVVQHVAMLHGGEASADNQPGGGAIFAVWLPADRCNPGAAA